MQVIKSTWRYANMIVCATYADKCLLGFIQIVNIAQIMQILTSGRGCADQVVFSAHADMCLLMQTFVCSALYS